MNYPQQGFPQPGPGRVPGGGPPPWPQPPGPQQWHPAGPVRPSVLDERTWSPIGLILGVLGTIALAVGLFLPPDKSGKSVVEQFDDEIGIVVLLMFIPVVVLAQVLVGTLPMRQGLRRWLGGGLLGLFIHRGTIGIKINTALMIVGLLVVFVSLTNPSFLLPSPKWRLGLYLLVFGGLVAELSVLLPHFKLGRRAAPGVPAAYPPQAPPPRQW
jgi:hypothetical protein